MSLIPPSVYEGQQVVINSDRLIFNTKLNEVMCFSKKDIYCNTQAAFIVDADEELIMNTPGPSLINSDGQMELKTANQTVVTSPKIYLGSNGATEHVVLGDTLLSIMNEMSDAIRALVFLNGAGPAALSPGSDAPLTAVQQKFRTYLSKQNYTL